MSETHSYNTGEVELSYLEWPGESPPVVAMHGISATKAIYLAEAKAGRHAYAYDHRGHGDSGRTPGAYNFVDYGRDAVAFLQAVVREPAILVGHSLGGMTAIYAAAHAPELVRAAFLIDPPLYAPEGPLRDEAEPFAATEKQAGKPLAELIAAGVPAFRAESVAKLDPGVMTMTLDRSGFAGWDTDAYLRAIECPVVLEHGDRDGAGGMGSAIYPGELDRALPLIRNCTVLHMAGTGHIPWLTQEQRFYDELRRFIDEV
jgi:pimeloyl-ACP methyl ester carboxylesterase